MDRRHRTGDDSRAARFHLACPRLPGGSRREPVCLPYPDHHRQGSGPSPGLSMASGQGGCRKLFCATQKDSCMLTTPKLTLMQELIAGSTREELIWLSGYLAGVVAQNAAAAPQPVPAQPAVLSAALSTSAAPAVPEAAA